MEYPSSSSWNQTSGREEVIPRRGTLAAVQVGSLDLDHLRFLRQKRARRVDEDAELRRRVGRHVDDGPPVSGVGGARDLQRRARQTGDGERDESWLDRLLATRTV